MSWLPSDLWSWIERRLVILVSPISAEIPHLSSWTRTQATPLRLPALQQRTLIVFFFLFFFLRLMIIVLTTLIASFFWHETNQNPCIYHQSNSKVQGMWEICPTNSPRTPRNKKEISTKKKNYAVFHKKAGRTMRMELFYHVTGALLRWFGRIWGQSSTQQQLLIGNGYLAFYLQPQL